MAGSGFLRRPRILAAALFLLAALTAAACGSAAESEGTKKAPREVTVITDVQFEDESDESGEEENGEAGIFDGLIRADGTVDVSKVPHLFIYPLINDYRVFDRSVIPEARITVNNSNNLTTSEFRELLAQLYSAGFVLVDVHDLVSIEKRSGGIIVTPNEHLVLPKGKLPLLLAEDNVNYHHSTDNTGYASKIVVQDGRLACSYVNANGTEKTGEYDAVPILESFIEKHPDFSYNGARMILALTGYNGVLGYRTDAAYRTGQGLTDLQKEWLLAHPDFDYEAECEAATETADALRKAGYVFANKTWGDRIVSSATLTDLKVDLEKWKASAEPIIGKAEIFVFGHDSDIGEAGKDYEPDNSKLAYYESEGYCIFCTSGKGMRTGESAGRNYLRSVRFPLTPYALHSTAHGTDPWAAETVRALGIKNIAVFLDHARPGAYAYIS